MFLLPVVGMLLLAGPAWAADPRVLCTIRDSRITESSGLAASSDRLWTLDDGGSRLQVFELDRTCRVRRVITNPIDPYDVEDLARAADGTFWLSDTGDNSLNRTTVALERLRPDGSATLFRLTYPDGPHDAEALLLMPSGQVYIATKDPLSSNVYTPVGPLSSARPTALRRVASIGLLPTGPPAVPVGTAMIDEGGRLTPAARAAAGRGARAAAARAGRRPGRHGRAGGGDRGSGVAGRAVRGAADLHRRVRVVGALRRRGRRAQVRSAHPDRAAGDRSG